MYRERFQSKLSKSASVVAERSGHVKEVWRNPSSAATWIRMSFKMAKKRRRNKPCRRRAKKPHKTSSSPSSFHFYLKQNLENKLSPACVTQVCNRAPRGLFAAMCVGEVICQLLTRKKIVKWKWWFLWFCPTYFKTLFLPFHLESCRVTGVHSWVFLVVKRSLLILIMLGRALLLMFRPA